MSAASPLSALFKASLLLEYIILGYYRVRLCNMTDSYTHILRRIIRTPADKRNLIPLSLAALKVVLDIKHSIASTNALIAATVLGLCVEQLLAESGVVAVCRRFLDDNFLPVVGDLVDYPG
jgi:hypothetical protein